MTKNTQNIINFPVEKKSQKKFKKVKKQDEIINHLLQDIEKRQIFLKDYTKGSDKYLIPENIDKVKIKQSDDIILPVNADCEFTDYVGNLTPTMHKNLILPIDLKMVYQF